jgi:WD40 repeat protein
MLTRQPVPKLRLVPDTGDGETHGDEVLACTYSPDSKYVLSGGWDGCLRLWDATNCASLGKIEVATKPVSACAISPDGLQLVSGTLDGMLARWDAGSRHQSSIFLAHTRPISAIAFANDGRTMATASWDRNLILWSGGGSGRDSRTLSGHSDIVAGCCFSANAQSLLSWSHDNTVRLWELSSARLLTTFKDFPDRVMCGAVSPDGRFAAFGTRDHGVKIYDVVAFKPVSATNMTGEVRCVMFTLDGQHVIAGDESGAIGIYSVPDLNLLSDVETNLPIQCGAIAPSGAQFAIGCNDGRIHLVHIDGFDKAPLVIHMIQQSKRTASTFQKLFGKSSEVVVLQGNCPVCHAAFEYPGTQVQTLACPGCRRKLRVGSVLSPSQDG